MKEEYKQLLLSTGRKGIEQVVDYLEKAGFYVAPASAGHHLNRDGGLLEHSLNVYRVAMRLRTQMLEMKPELEDRVREDSVVIVSLLHDICKTNIYKKTTRYRKDSNGRWESYDGYETDYGRFPVGHGEKSVIMLLRLGLELTNDEIVAIRWHMSAWDLAFQSNEMKGNISKAFDHFPLASVIQTADMLASHILEVE